MINVQQTVTSTVDFYFFFIKEMTESTAARLKSSSDSEVQFWAQNRI